MGFFKFLKGFGFRKIKDGVMLTWGTGPIFDPTYQTRIDGLQDLVNQKSKETDEIIEKLKDNQKEQ